MSEPPTPEAPIRPIVLACSSDRGYVPHSAAMIHSALAHAKAPLHVHYLHGDTVTRRQRRLLAGMVERGGGEITFHRIAGETVAGLPVHSYFTEAMWYRIMLPELLPAEERVLYLDVDTVVLDQLDPLWQADLADAYIAAVTNVFEPWHTGRPRELGLSGPEAYFNSGVLLMNLALMRRDGCVGALRDYATANAATLMWPDQDALNVVLGGRRHALPPRWNCTNAICNFESSADIFGAIATAEARDNPAIRHFEGPGDNKPWHRGCRQPRHDAYFEHRSQTPWPRVALEPVADRGSVRRLGSQVIRRLRGLPGRLRG